MYNYNDSYSKDMFNLVPMKNIIFYINKIGVFDTNIIIHNMIYPVIIWIPMGFLINSFDNFYLLSKKNKIFIFIIFLFLLFSIRVIFLMGFFDVDKIILGLIGFIIGLGLYECYSSFLRYIKKIYNK